MKSFLILTAFFSASSVYAQSAGGGWGFRSYAGAGYSNINVSNSTRTLDMNGGLFIYLGAEKTLNDDGLSVTGMLNYTRASGSATYDFTTGTSRYQGSDVDVDWNNYQLSLGLRQRFYPWPWLRPYVEGGGLFGYNQLSYDSANINLTSGPGASPTTKENVTSMGFYGETGLEIDIADNFGTRIGVRYQKSQTGEVETLANQRLKYDAVMLQLALMLSL